MKVYHAKAQESLDSRVKFEMIRSSVVRSLTHSHLSRLSWTLGAREGVHVYHLAPHTKVQVYLNGQIFKYIHLAALQRFALLLTSVGLE